MLYAELSYFEGYHFAHVAAWQEAQRLKRKRLESLRALNRRN